VNNELFEESLEQFVVSTVSLAIIEPTRGFHILFETLSYLSIDSSAILEALPDGQNGKYFYT
jgi:hypothetical protein